MLEAVDLFCGAGGTSTGILQAAQTLHVPLRLTAVNHWQTAINTHSLNHPGVRHICEPVENIFPRRVVPGGRLRLLAASCECTFHSNARGGGPCNEQSRSQPWQIIRWATDIDVDDILMENVREWINWGPLHPRTKRPIKSRRGEYFSAFTAALQNLGYKVSYRIQVCADYGDPTTRKRLILLARKRRPIVWPEPTHGPGRACPWPSARQHVIDWSLRGRNLLGADGKPRLCANTVARIYAGFESQGPAAEPFLGLLRGTSKSHINSSHRSMDIAGAIRLVEPFIVTTDQTGGGGNYVRPVDQPIATVVSKQNMMFVEPFLIKYYGSGENHASVNSPLPTVTTADRFGLVSPVQEGIRYGILTRMLEPHELARAHSFPAHYKFTGAKRDAVKQIGNSVPVKLAQAHAAALFAAP